MATLIIPLLETPCLDASARDVYKSGMAIDTQEANVNEQEMLRKANHLIDRAHALMDLGEFATVDALLDEAERLTDEAERVGE